jgi:glycosyltransferase involved in cell wall biosynthesis
MPKVSVIVPCFNLESYLPDALNSVLAQTFPDWECIIVDDGSKDNSCEVAKDYIVKDSRFRLFTQENAGVSFARNRGVRESGGEYLLFLDADDILLPDYMAKAVAILDRDQSIKVVSGQAQQFGKGVHTRKMTLPPFSMEQLIAQNCLYVTSFVRREVFDTAGGFCKDFPFGWEDWDFWLSALKEDGDAIVLPEIVFRYRQRKDSRNRDFSTEDIRQMRRRIWERHKELYARYFFDPTLSGEYAKSEYYRKKYGRFPGIKLYRLVSRTIRKGLGLW